METNACLVDIKKSFKDFSLSIDFETDGTIALFGPSGAGKSLIFKMIAGIETPDEGRIVIGKTVVYDSEKKINLRPQDRNVGLLFQDYALFPNMSARQNIEIANKDNKDIDIYLKKFKIKEFENLYPHQMSGGQKQRCAMARMLITSPDLIMLDEPFNALDSELKKVIKAEVREILKEVNKPAIIVSHDREEVEYFTDRIINVNGRLL